MELMVKTITKMADLLKESFGDRLNILEIDEEKGELLALFDEKPLNISYKYGDYLIISVEPENRQLLEYLRPTFRLLTNNFSIHFGFDHSSLFGKTSNLMWDFVNPEGMRAKILSLDEYSHEVFYNGGLKGIPSLMAKREKAFVPLPKEQQLTEEGLIALERRIAKAAKKNEHIRVMSEYYASLSKPCKDDGSKEEDNDPGKKYTKK